jgi:hypothetical protein
MADYFTQTVIRPEIPRTAMTELEWRILSDMFEHEELGEEIYFFASQGPNELVFVAIAEVRRLLDEIGVASSVADLVREELGACEADAAELILDFSMIGFEGIFQDVIRRSALDYIEVEAAWTCSKMRSDGFGGAATLITADDIESVSTAGFLEAAVARVVGPAPPG